MSDRLTAQQKKFAEVYAATKDALAAYKAAYGSGDGSKTIPIPSEHITSPRVKALIEEIQQGVRAQLVMLAPEALKNIIDLANNAESEKVRLEANKEILYGSGLKPPEVVHFKSTGIFGMTTLDELKDYVRMSIESDASPSSLGVDDNGNGKG